MVELYDVILKAGYSTENVAIIGSGFPKPVSNVSIEVPDNGSNGTTESIRLQLNTNGVLQPWYTYNTKAYSITTTIVYITAS